GGPVKPDTGIALAVLRSADVGAGLSGLQPIDGRVHVGGLDTDPESLDERIEGMRVFVRYTGWAPGQLQDALDRGHWYVAPRLPSDLLAPTHVDVRVTGLRGQEMPLPLYATYVGDGDVN